MTPEAENRLKSQQQLSQSESQLEVDFKQIQIGPNNQFVQNLSFQVDIVSKKVARLELTDNDHQRYSVPETAVPKMSADDTLKLDDLGFIYNLNPFSFSFKDTLDPNNVFVTT